MRWSRHGIRWLALLGMVAAAGLAWILSAPRPAFSGADAPRFENGDAARGKLVFDAGQCASCHATPGQPDRLRLGGGLALGSPFGNFYPPNISPDPEDGIGRWRGLDLANALVSGVSPDGQHYYPALPYVGYAHMRPEDLRDLMAYLRSLPPVAGRTPAHDLPFPLTIRRGVGFWKLLFLEQGPVADDPSRDALWNRGRYLVETLAHCAECHSTRNLLYAVKSSRRFAGGPDQEGTGFVPNITPHAIGGWSEDQLVELLTTGRTPDLRVVRSSMEDVVRNMSALPEEDRRAITRFIRSLPSRPTPGPEG
ncbi:cytochrome c [Roseomonas marmotae]|uniref:C-type cytochrome n=1 Tax=Roseomonas marmotae TaxID=2768161 RepID=A0ABS3KES5_9PROT|nr:cytochrome c [Roseomonas marmotae]MBO1075512.1 c-type cytochrome [Roseomonas marmotae]QTI81455.1 c-type cytochrome [Roseomonas marmotae]